MSGDRSPQSGSGLDVTTRPDLANGTAQRPLPPEPSLATVFATTLRLWLRRRVLRVADGNRVGPLRRAAVAVVLLVVAGAAGGGAVAALRIARVAPPRSGHHVRRISPGQAETAANERIAAAWIAAQVAAGTMVACDPAMCADLQSAGFPAAKQLTLQPAAGLPGVSGLVVATGAARVDAGPQLLTGAPQVIASFGTGAEIVEVRVLGRTPAGFRSAARAMIAADRKSARDLARNHRLHLAGPSRAQLLSGLVDMRLVVVLGRLVAAHPVYVTTFSNAGPGLAWPAVLRAVSITGLVRGPGQPRVSDLRAVLKLLRGQRPPFLAIVRERHGPGGQVTLTIGFPAPSPLSAPGGRRPRQGA